ncbi:protein HokA, partial [Escherichia coli]
MHRHHKVSLLLVGNQHS